MNQIVYNNRADILAAIEKNDKSILPYASPKLRNKINIAQIAVKRNWREVQFVSFRLRNNMNFMTDILFDESEAL